MTTCDAISHCEIEHICRYGDQEVFRSSIKETQEAILPVLKLYVGVYIRELIIAPFRNWTLPISVKAHATM